jgi:hypothetical protein
LPDPKAFISYSWSSDAHQLWVINLATQLRENGVDVILDKWDLKEGHDAIAFMEQMVSDASVKKVVVILDRVYAEKADGRQGGVGTETQIITPQIYKSVDQNKFCGVISEVGADGKPFLPVFYSARIYIDLSNDDIFVENFDQLLRWIFDKPAFPKPALGRAPDFLSEQNVLLPTRSRAARAVNLLRSGSAGNSAALQDYLESFAENLEVLRLKPTDNVEFDDLVFTSIEALRPYRDEFVAVITAMAKGSPNDQNIGLMRRFFEQLIPYMFRSEGMTQYHESWFDNYRFIAHEFLLYFIAILIKQELFSKVDDFLTGGFYVGGVSSLAHEPIQPSSILLQTINSLNVRKKRLNLNRLSLHADMIRDRLPAIGITLGDLMQADLVLFIRDAADSVKANRGNRWDPVSLIWSERSGPFEIFARSVSTKYFQRIVGMLGVADRDEFLSLLSHFGKGDGLYLPHWNYSRLSLDDIVQPAKLGTRI